MHNRRMGLDGVELVMAVEEAFDIQIDDAQAGKLLTPRLLTDYVLGQVTTATASVCLTQRAFNLLRKSLIHQCGFKRSQIAPDVSLPQLLPKPQRRKVIRQVVAELGIKKPPEFVRPKWLITGLFVASILSGMGAVVLARPSAAPISLMLFAVVATGIGVMGVKLTQPLCKEFPKELQTIGDLSRWVMTHKGDLADATPSGWTREQITIRVRELIVEQLGVKPGFSEDARFIQDLGMD